MELLALVIWMVVVVLGVGSLRLLAWRVAHKAGGLVIDLGFEGLSLAEAGLDGKRWRFREKYKKRDERPPDDIVPPFSTLGTATVWWGTIDRSSCGHTVC